MKREKFLITKEEKELKRHIVELKKRIEALEKLTKPDNTLEWMRQMYLDATRKLAKLEQGREDAKEAARLEKLN